jgi:hypothetical protein
MTWEVGKDFGQSLWRSRLANKLMAATIGMLISLLALPAGSAGKGMFIACRSCAISWVCGAGSKS